MRNARIFCLQPAATVGDKQEEPLPEPWEERFHVRALM